MGTFLVVFVSNLISSCGHLNIVCQHPSLNIVGLTSPFSKCKQDDIKLLTKTTKKVCSCDGRTTQATGNHYQVPSIFFFFFFFFFFKYNLPELFYEESFAVKKKVLNIP